MHFSIGKIFCCTLWVATQQQQFAIMAGCSDLITQLGKEKWVIFNGRACNCMIDWNVLTHAWKLIKSYRHPRQNEAIIHMQMKSALQWESYICIPLSAGNEYKVNALRRRTLVIYGRDAHTRWQSDGKSYHSEIINYISPPISKGFLSVTKEPSQNITYTLGGNDAVLADIHAL